MWLPWHCALFPPTLRADAATWCQSSTGWAASPPTVIQTSSFPFCFRHRCDCEHVSRGWGVEWSAGFPPPPPHHHHDQCHSKHQEWQIEAMEARSKRKEEKKKEMMASCNIRQHRAAKYFCATSLARTQCSSCLNDAWMMHWSKKKKIFRRQICKLKQSQVDKLTFCGP